MKKLFRTKQELFKEAIEKKKKELHKLHLDKFSEELEIDDDWVERNINNNSNWEMEELDNNYIRI